VSRRPAHRQTRRCAPTVEIVISSPLWKQRRSTAAVLRRAIAAAAAVSMTTGELAVVLTDDSESRRLNRDWRHKNAATNVLSFPAPKARSVRGKPHLLGDIVIAYETTEREARAERKPFTHHLAHLAVHGFLHLVGYDHEVEDAAEEMEGLETVILARLAVPDPYFRRAPSPIDTRS
jgi:probable rRNA maturation factor